MDNAQRLARLNEIKRATHIYVDDIPVYLSRCAELGLALDTNEIDGKEEDDLICACIYVAETKEKALAGDYIAVVEVVE